MVFPDGASVDEVFPESSPVDEVFPDGVSVKVVDGVAFKTVDGVVPSDAVFSGSAPSADGVSESVMPDGETPEIFSDGETGLPDSARAGVCSSEGGFSMGGVSSGEDTGGFCPDGSTDGCTVCGGFRNGVCKNSDSGSITAVSVSMI